MLTQFLMQFQWIWRGRHFCHPALPLSRGDEVHMLALDQLLDVVAAEQRHEQKTDKVVNSSLDDIPEGLDDTTMCVMHTPALVVATTAV